MIDIKKLITYMAVAFVAAFFGALNLVPGLDRMAVTKAVIVGGTAAGLAGKAFLDSPTKGV